jgi:hypothetical protein
MTFCEIADLEQRISVEYICRETNNLFAQIFAAMAF